MRGLLAIFKLLRRKLMGKVLISSRRFNGSSGSDDDEASSRAEDLPEDVKEGHFVVHAVDNGEPKRFVLELAYLEDPDFLNLLKQAEEEFGFRSEGVLAVPCGPNELQKVLKIRKKRKGCWGGEPVGLLHANM